MDIWQKRKRLRAQGRSNLGTLTDEQKNDVRRMAEEGLSFLEIQRRTLVSPRKTAELAGKPNASSGKVYVLWQSMMQRCYNPEHPNYADYGGRGIRVCQRWCRSFGNFKSDIGEPPSATHTLDRIENEKNYTPSNVRWATRREQSRNRRFCRASELKAKAVRTLAPSFTQAQIAELLDLLPTTVSQIIRGEAWADG